jgi:hypothetical protein
VVEGGEEADEDAAEEDPVGAGGGVFVEELGCGVEEDVAEAAGGEDFGAPRFHQSEGMEELGMEEL